MNANHSRATADKRNISELRDLIQTAKKRKKIGADAVGEYVGDDPIRGSVYQIISNGVRWTSWFDVQGHARYERNKE